MHLGEDTNIILGMTWLKEANPHISWDALTLSYNVPIQGKASNNLTLPNEFSNFADMFSKELFKTLPPHKGEYNCAIDFKKDAVLTKPAWLVPMSDANSLRYSEELEAQLKAGKIQKLTSCVAAGAFYVPKADGSSRLVVDYWKINNMTKSDQFPLPSQVDLLEKVREAKIFSELDP